MQVSNGEIWQAKQSLDALLKQPWPIKTAYRLAKLSQKLGRRVAIIDQVRNKLINEYGEADERGRVAINQDSPRWAVFVPFFNELMAEEDEMDFQPVVLPTDGGISIPPETLLALLSFVEVEGEEDTPEASDERTNHKALPERIRRGEGAPA